MRKINFEQFTTALYLCAERREQSMKRLSEEVVAAGGPSYFGTFAEPNRLCDDKTLYTGVCAQYTFDKEDQSNPDYGKVKKMDKIVITDVEEDPKAQN